LQLLEVVLHGEVQLLNGSKIKIINNVIKKNIHCILSSSNIRHT